MKPQKSEIVTPKPYFKIKFGCSNRKFYDVKNELWNISEDIGIELQDGYISEECDYEGDLERIIIYNGKRSEKLIHAVMKYYGLENTELPDNMGIHLTIF